MDDAQEQALEKILRLTRSYTRTHLGQRQMVRQYPTPHPGHTTPGAAVNGKLPKVQTTWNKIKDGAIVDFGGEPWKVLHSQTQTATGTPNKKGTTTGKTTGSKGKAVNTKGGGKGGSKGKAVNTKGGASGKGTKSNTLITHVLENLWTGKRVQISLNAAFKVWVY